MKSRHLKLGEVVYPSLVSCAWGVVSEKPLPHAPPQRRTPVSSPKIVVSALVFRSSVYFDLVFMRSVSSFACGSVVVPAPFVEKTIFCH